MALDFSDFKNKYFLALIICVAAFFLLWENPLTISWNVNKIVNLLVAAAVWASLVFFTFKVTLKTETRLRNKFTQIAYLLWILVLIISYVAAEFKETQFAFFGLIISIIIIIGELLINSFLKLNDSKSRPAIIFHYVIFSFLLIFIFGLFYTMVDANPANAPSSNEYLFFSAQTYYVASVTDFAPVGEISKIISIIQIGVSFILHTIILAQIINRNK